MLGLGEATMSSMLLQSIVLSEDQFIRISELVKSLCGINLHQGKKKLVEARLSKRIRRLKFNNFDRYIDYVASDTSGVELMMMLDALSTNLTHFFREGKHFEYLANEVLPGIIRRSSGNRRLRIWSAGCSSGEEPYTLSMVLRETINDIDLWDAKILATDLSTRMIEAARRGIYDHAKLRETPPAIISKYFNRSKSQCDNLFQVRPQVQSLVHFARLNLMEDWPMKGPFDVIFCRNVMIYFDKPTQTRLINRFYDILAPGGILFLGHSESLTGTIHQFRYVHPTVYRKP